MSDDPKKKHSTAVGWGAILFGFAGACAIGYLFGTEKGRFTGVEHKEGVKLTTLMVAGLFFICVFLFGAALANWQKERRRIKKRGGGL